MSTTHQPGQAVFRSVLPEDIDWEPFRSVPAFGTPRRRRGATVRAGAVRRAGQGAGRREADAAPTPGRPGVHGDLGVFYIGRGDEFDEEKLQAYPPGSVVVLPGETSHFHWAKSGEYVTQVQAIGPISLEYVNPRDDPRADGPEKP